MACESCGEKPKKCDKGFTRTVVEINNPEQITLMRRVVIPASMGDDTTVPPAIGKYKNVLLYYESNGITYLYSSDGIPTRIANGFTNYADATNLPSINGVTLLGDKTLAQLGIQGTLTVAENTGLALLNDTLSGIPATDSYIGMIKPGNVLTVNAEGMLDVNIATDTEIDNAIIL